MPQESIDYNHELATLIELIKSNTPEGERVIEVLKSGNEGEIRRMLINFGNLDDDDWKNITIASPWTNWQINEVITDRNKIYNPDVEGPFWGWHKHFGPIEPEPPEFKPGSPEFRSG